MAAIRSADLQSFLTLAEAAIRHGSVAGGEIRVAADRMFAALQTPATDATLAAPARLPVCANLPTALENARHHAGPVGELAGAFAAIEPQLQWKVRPGAETHGEVFLKGHANATIVGPEGMERRGDVWIGVSLMAPYTRYPDHHHPPEEIYVVCSGGEWRQANGPWHAPGIGGLVHNPPDIVHAMRSMDQPLLALWFLWTGSDAPSRPAAS